MNPVEKKLRQTLGLKHSGEGQINYSVKAGAGGGKTTLLSERICEQILKGAPIEDFVIITYTNAAAAELREKITVRLQAEMDAGTRTDNEVELARNALNNIELMQISTIHAFLLKILKENAFEANVVLDVRMLEDHEDTARREKYFDKWYREHYGDIQAFAADWIHVTKENREYDVTRQVFQNLFHDIANIREEIVFDVSDHTADIEKYAVSFVSDWIGKLDILRDAINDNMKKPDGKTRSVNKEAGRVVELVNFVGTAAGIGTKEAEAVSEALKGICEIIEKKKNIYSRCKDNFPNIDDAMYDIYTALPEFKLEWDFKQYLKMTEDAGKAAKVVEYVITMQREYQKELDKETLVLSNDDILYRAEKLLSMHPDILDKIRNKYGKIYVDEFQDTTGLQTRIVKMIAEKAGTDPEKENLEVGKLLVVGDPKQSIYRFTGAEKAVYDAVDHMMDKLPDIEAQSVSLDTNFRSNESIVNWVNQSFRTLMPGSYTDMETDWKVTEQNALFGVFQYCPDLKTDATGKEISYNRETDVEEVTSLVQRLVGKEYCFVQERDGNGEGSSRLRKIQYSDIMIICKNTTHMSDFVKRFAEMGIPVNVQGKFKINDDVVLKNFVHLMDYFSGYKNKKNRVTAAQIMEGLDAIKASPDSVQSVEEKLWEITTYFQKEQLDAAAKVQYLLSREDLFLPKGQIQKAEDVRAYRIRLHQMVETCLFNNNGDLRKLTEQMLDYIENDVKREIPLESNENALRLMNAHQSKGLTGQIVIIADRTANEGCRYSGFRKGGKYYPTVSYKVSENTSAVVIPSYGWNMDTLKQVYRDETEEAIRLQYVAATRAAQALIIMPVASKSTTPWFTKKEYKYTELPDVNAWLKGREADPVKYALTNNSTTQAHEVLTLEDLAESARKTDVTTLTGIQMTSITPSGLEPAGVTGYIPSDKGFVKESRPGGNVFGTVLHRVYELIFNNFESIAAMSADEKENAITRFINMAILEQLDEMRAEDKPDQFRDYLKAVMLRYMDAVIAPIVASAEEIYPEYTFSFFVPDDEKADFVKDFGAYLNSATEKTGIESGKIWINGQADLVVKQKDGSVRIYDYKSDVRNGKSIADFEISLSKKYEGQLALYRYAIGKTFEVSKVQTEIIHLYLCGDDVTSEVANV